jgi:hypothetical protein
MNTNEITNKDTGKMGDLSVSQENSAQALPDNLGKQENNNSVSNSGKMGDLSVTQGNSTQAPLDNVGKQENRNKLDNSSEMGKVTISQKNDGHFQQQAPFPPNLSQNTASEKPMPVIKSEDTSLAGAVAKSEDASLAKEVPRWFPIAGVIFTAITVLLLSYLLLGHQDIPTNKHVVFDVLAAICAAASASFFGGSARANGNLPWPAWLGGNAPPLQFVTAGGFAVFIIALLILLNAYH